MSSAFDRIMADPTLAGARKKLSARDIYTIIRHVWAADEERAETRIRINGKEHRWEAVTISHENICWLCAEPPHASVTWKHRGRRLSGMTSPGQEIAVYPNMEIDCVVTGNA